MQILVLRRVISTWRAGRKWPGWAVAIPVFRVSSRPIGLEECSIFVASAIFFEAACCGASRRKEVALQSDLRPGLCPERSCAGAVSRGSPDAPRTLRRHQLPMHLDGHRTHTPYLAG